jgi:hypothetical protein
VGILPKRQKLNWSGLLSKRHNLTGVGLLFKRHKFKLEWDYSQKGKN